MELGEVLQVLDSTTAVLVLVAILWRLLAQIERVVTFAEALIMALVERISDTPPPSDSGE